MLNVYILIASMNKILIDYEFHTGLGPTYAARLLGVAYTTYAQYRRDARVLPLYVRRHIETIQALPAEILNEQILKYAPKRDK